MSASRRRGVELGAAQLTAVIDGKSLKIKCFLKPSF